MTGEQEKAKKQQRSTEDRQLMRWAVAVFVVAVAVYANALFNGFVYDDVDQVVGNPWIRSAEHVREIFSSGSWSYSRVTSNYYRPVMHLLYMVGYAVFGLAPSGFHLMNIFFHGGVSVLVVLVTARLLKMHSPDVALPYINPPGIAGLLFAAHPIHTEAVSWISGIPDVSFTFFGLLAFSLYLNAPEDGKRTRSISSLCSLGFFFVALLSKETALVLPVLFVIYEATVRKGSGLRDSFGRVAPYIVAVSLYFLLRTAALGGLAPIARFRELTFYQTLLNVFPLFFKYMAMLFLPVRLSVFHGFEPATSVLDPAVLAALFFAASLVIVAEILRRKSRVAFFGLALVVVPLVPVLYIRYLGENPFAERYLYFPSIGFVVLAALLVQRLAAASARAFSVVLAPLALILIFSAGTVSRNAVWKNDRTLWQDAAKKSPDAPIAHFNYGAIVQSEGDTEQAIAHYQIALKLKPSEKVYYNLGLAYDSIGQTDKAIEQFQMAIRVNPGFVMAYNSLGAAFLNTGAFTEAIDQFQAAIRLDRRYADAYYNLGVGYETLGMKEKALESYSRAAELSPGNQQARARLEELRRN